MPNSRSAAVHCLIANSSQATTQLYIVAIGRLGGSKQAAHILENWEEFRPKFVKVMPTEYRRALEEIETAQMAANPAA